MSGTSADALDGALVDLASEQHPVLLATHSLPLPELRPEIHALAHPGSNEIQRMGHLGQRLAAVSAAVVHNLLEQSGHHPRDIAAIGSHGQTLRHEPPGQSPHPFTLQVGDPSAIAELTGITTVADFRCRDIAAGGHGAPLAPAFHQAVFSSAAPCAVVNIGGMANITLLPGDGSVSGFDTGPGNCLMDGWVQQHLATSFDDEGQWAAQGKVITELLDSLLADPFFRLAPPKSTGREYFHRQWLDHHLSTRSPIASQDVQATLLELTARSIVAALGTGTGETETLRFFVCGGGAHNRRLMERLSQLSGLPVDTTAALGVDPQWVEAMAFAWLASRTMRGLPGNAPQVTGARRPVILGGIYPGQPLD